MARLIEPDGTPNAILPVQKAIDYCKSHPGWTWEYWNGSDCTDVM